MPALFLSRDLTRRPLTYRQAMRSLVQYVFSIASRGREPLSLAGSFYMSVMATIAKPPRTWACGPSKMASPWLDTTPFVVASQ
jgi:hypothetical protein